MRRVCTCLIMGLIAVLLAGCLSDDRAIPTASTIEMAQTAEFLTKNAPPPGFDRVQFPRIDDNLDKLPSWHYSVSLTFDGVYTDTQEKVTGLISAEIFSNEATDSQRVLLKASGAAFGIVERTVEGVRISNDYYLVDQNKVCSRATDSPSDRAVADLSAGDLVGGIKSAIPLGQRKTVLSWPLWEYTFLPGDVVIPTIKLGDGGSLAIAAGDLWVAPSQNAVFEYTVTFNVQKATLLGSRPLTGLVRAGYRLLETGVAFNIAIPYGC